MEARNLLLHDVNQQFVEYVNIEHCAINFRKKKVAHAVVVHIEIQRMQS